MQKILQGQKQYLMKQDNLIDKANKQHWLYEKLTNHGDEIEDVTNSSLYKMLEVYPAGTMPGGPTRFRITSMASGINKNLVRNLGITRNYRNPQESNLEL